MKHQNKKLPKLLHNVRFYILSTSIITSIVIAVFLWRHIPSERLFFIRLEQVYGFVSLGFLYIALLISPLGVAICKRSWYGRVIFARRAIGVSAAYFALLHAAPAFFKQFGDFAGFKLLPGLFQWSMGIAAIGLVVLLAMAVTSTDWAIRRMTVRYWSWLHRFVYAAGFLILVHVWTIGAHAAYLGVKQGLFIALLVLLVLEWYRVVTGLAQRYKNPGQIALFLLLASLLWLAGLSLLVLLPGWVSNYHDERHSNHAHNGGIQ